MQKPDFLNINLHHPPIVSWGDASFRQAPDNNAVLLIGWGKYLLLVIFIINKLF